MKQVSLTLDSGWKWKQRDHKAAPTVLEELTAHETWNKAETFPSDIYVELLKAGKIPDPYVGFNEHKVQWVAHADWLYSTTFTANDVVKNAAHTDLVFEGLDTICTVYLNGHKILSSDNMFTPYTVTLPANALASTNTLLLDFGSAYKRGKELEAKYGKVRAGSVNLGDPSRVYVRKAQYHWRWDWGPELMSVGPYLPIHLISYTTRVTTLYPRALVSPNLSTSLSVDVDLSGTLSQAKKAKVSLKSADGAVVKEETVHLSGAKTEVKDLVEWTFEEGKVKLWWPTGYGEQELYTTEVTLLDHHDKVLDVQKKKIGFRRVELIQEPVPAPGDRYGTGTTFLFEVNGVRIWMGGSNWVPADNMLTTISADRYKKWLQLAKDGNHNMIRLWGGGVYEPDVFYETCDELGILVWQDFEFACGVYPAYAEFVASVKAEAEEAVKRLRTHPSMAIFCGNNEDYQQPLQWGIAAELPARLLYEHIFPEVVGRLTNSTIPYHFGSPYGGNEWYETANPTLGDLHQWEIWASPSQPYQDYYKMGGRFVSEFGIPSIPDIRTVDHWLGPDSEKERFAQSRTMQQHVRAGQYERRFALIMNDNFKLTADFETHIFLTQIMQSEALGGAYRSWRREWRGKGKQFIAGALVWQLNDSWPVTSWAIADYYLRTKPSYYTVKRELAPITVGTFRSVQKNRDCDRPIQFYEFGAFQSVSATIEVWGFNATLKEKKVVCEITCYDLEDEQWTHEEKHDVVLLPNQSTEIVKKAVPHRHHTGHTIATPSYSVIVSTRLVDPSTGAIIARYVDWPQPFKFLEFPNPQLELKVEGEKVTVEAKKPLKGLVLSVHEEGEEVKWSDNALDLVPGDAQVVTAGGLKGRKIRVAWLGKEKATVY